MRPGISEEFFASTDIDQLLAMSSREVEQLGRLAFPIALAPGDRNFRRIAWDDVFELAGAHYQRPTAAHLLLYERPVKQ